MVAVTVDVVVATVVVTVDVPPGAVAVLAGTGNLVEQYDWAFSSVTRAEAKTPARP